MGRRILLVEDQEADREILATELELAGQQVVAVANDQAAYATIEQEARNFDLLVADIDLGQGTTGFDVARAARSANPEILVAYVSALDVSTRAHQVPGSLLFKKDLRLRNTAVDILKFAEAVGAARS